MCPELEQIRRELERITHNFSPEDWQRAPSGRWSSILIAEHILLSYLSTTLGLLRAIHSGKPSATEVTLYGRVATFLVAGLGYFPAGRVAPPQAIPKGSLSPASMQKIYNALAMMDARLFEAEQHFGLKVRVLDHPSLGPLTAQEWRGFHRTHSLHHLKQIEKRGGVSN